MRIREPSLALTLLMPLIMSGCGDGKPAERSEATQPMTTQPAAGSQPAAVSLPAATAAPAAAPAPMTPPASAAFVYQWDPTQVQAGVGRVSAAAETAADGTQRQLFTTTGDGWNTLLTVPKVLQGGKDYLAVVRYEVVTPPPFIGKPFNGTFHMYARSATLGQSRDVWLNWVGNPNDHGTARLPMTLPPADDWVFYVGCKGQGSIRIESLAIQAGNGTTFVPAPAPLADAPAPAAETSPTVATGCPRVELTPPQASTGAALSAVTFGMVADGAEGPVSPAVAEANATALRKAIEACSKQGASILTIPKGTYRIGLKAPLEFQKQHDLIIDGQGSVLLFTKLMRNSQAFQLMDCERLVFRDLSIDWDWDAMPICSLAQVESVSADRHSATFYFPELTPATTEWVMKADWSQVAFADNPRSSAPKPDPKSLERRESAGPNRVAVRFYTPQPMTVGQAFTMRHLYYEMSAFKVNSCNNLLFERVNIWSIPGMGWICRGDMHHIALKQCNVAPAPGSKRRMSTAADGFHIGESQGNILVEDCTFLRTGDDCINIHDTCYQGVRKTGPRTLILEGNPKYRLRVAVGDRLELFRADYAPIGHIGTVARVEYPAADTLVEFAEDLPAQVSPLSIVFNRRYGSKGVRLVRNHFTHGRVLLSVEDATIEDNQFEETALYAILLEADIKGSLWSEGNGARNIVIRKNSFADINWMGRNDGTVIFGMPLIPAGRTEYPIFQNLLIEDNRFVGSRGPIINFGACAQVVVHGNRIESDTAPSGMTALAGSLYVERGSDLRLGGNTWKAGPGQAKPGVIFEADTIHGLSTEGNQLIDR